MIKFLVAFIIVTIISVGSTDALNLIKDEVNGVNVTQTLIDCYSAIKNPADLAQNFPPDKLPESRLCAKKCFYEKIKMLQPNGRLVAMDEVKKASEELLGKSGDVTRFVNCMKNVGTIANCQDARKLAECDLEIEGGV